MDAEHGVVGGLVLRLHPDPLPASINATDPLPASINAILQASYKVQTIADLTPGCRAFLLGCYWCFDGDLMKTGGVAEEGGGVYKGVSRGGGKGREDRGSVAKGKEFEAGSGLGAQRGKGEKYLAS